MENCIFCKLANGVIKTDMVFENDMVAAFKDANPQAPTHVLVVPKAHISSVDEITGDNSPYVSAIFEVVPTIAKKLGVEGNYRIISNCGEGAGQSVFHLHFHIISGSPLLKERLI